MYHLEYHMGFYLYLQASREVAHMNHDNFRTLVSVIVSLLATVACNLDPSHRKDVKI